jgi:hypothetical protein
MWFQNNKPNEMLLGVYGLLGGQSVLRYMWPEHEIGTGDLGKTFYFNYDEMQEVNYQVDHITCHADGTFHIKTKNHKPIYTQEMKRSEPPGPNTNQFLEIIVYSDFATTYSALSKPTKTPFGFIEVQKDLCVSLRGIFSGTNYNLENEVLGSYSQLRASFIGGVITSGTIKSMLLAQPMEISGSAKQNRPKGTIVTVQFPLNKDKWRLKTFLFQ